MPGSVEISNLGKPVEITEIDCELKNLWKQSAGQTTRASLVNLALYSEAPGALERNTELVSKITENHACRAIVIKASQAAKENCIQAWINTHCHVNRAGGKPICSEQLSFLIEGPCLKFLPSIVFSHLDSDLPFYLWWQGDFHDPMDPQLWAWVDRLIYDSQPWRDFRAQIRLVETAQSETKQRVVLCDLNWTRIVHVRLALAQFFDHPASHHHFNEINGAEIDFAPGYRSTGLLLIGWLAAQLEWKFVARNNGTLRFRNSLEKEIEVRLQEKTGEPIGRCLLRSGPVEFLVTHPAGTDLLDVSYEMPDRKRTQQFMPAGAGDDVHLMSEELMRGGPRHVYLRALNCIRDFF